MMKKIGLLAVLVVLAGPAWAANDEKPQTEAWRMAVDICVPAFLASHYDGRHLDVEVAQIGLSNAC
jgi:hypothetical protein